MPGRKWRAKGQGAAQSGQEKAVLRPAFGDDGRMVFEPCFPQQAAAAGDTVLKK